MRPVRWLHWAMRTAGARTCYMPAAGSNLEGPAAPTPPSSGLFHFLTFPSALGSRRAEPGSAERSRR
jgi:hypothetical protein